MLTGILDLINVFGSYALLLKQTNSNVMYKVCYNDRDFYCQSVFNKLFTYQWVLSNFIYFILRGSP